jgi:hypothetical protein
LDHDTPVYDEYRVMQLKQDIEKIKSILWKY